MRHHVSNRARLCFTLVSVLICGASQAQLPRAEPQEMGFSAERLNHVDRFYAEKVRNGDLAGIVLLIARHGQIAHFSAIGYADVEKRKRMEPDTIFRLYSMTKPVSAVALMMLYEEGRFQMNDPLSKYIPEFANLRVLRHPDGPLDDTVALDRAPTMHDLLRHTAGFSHGVFDDRYDAQYVQADLFGLEVSLAEMVTRLSRMPLRYQPGTRYAYSVGADIQARLVEILSGMSFDTFLQKRLFAPLGMKDTGFWVPPGKAMRLATVHWEKKEGSELVPLDQAHGHPPGLAVDQKGFQIGSAVVQPELVNSYTTNHRRKGGSFGLVSTAEDYWRFAQMMLNRGEFHGERILSPQVVQYMTRNHLELIGPHDLPGIGSGLGFAVMQDPVAAGYMSSVGTYFWAGAAGTHFWIDPKNDMVVIAMTQHMGVPAADALWAELRTLIYSALVE